MSIKSRKEKQKEQEGWKDRINRLVLGIPVLITIYLIFMLLYTYPHWPIDMVGWVILVFAGIPVSLGLEWLGEITFSRERGKHISSSGFSIIRVAVAFTVLVTMIVAMGILWIAGGSFISHHFK